MGIVFVVGFFDCVQATLASDFAYQMAVGSVSWIGFSKGRIADLTAFKSAFFDALARKRPPEVLVLLGRVRESQWVEQQVQSFLDQGRLRHPRTVIKLEVLDDLSAAVQVKAAISTLQLQTPSDLSLERIEAKLSGNKVICIVADGRPTFKQALERSGFAPLAIDRFFDEEIVPGGRNSTLMEHLEKYAQYYCHMLYAWDGLRTSGKGLVKAFKSQGQFYEGPTAAKVVEIFRRWLIS